MPIEFIILLIAGYLMGSVPMGYLLIKWSRGVDIRKYGSGQTGGSNVFRNFSKPLGVIVAIFDLGKGALMIWISQLFGLEIGYQMAIGIAAVIGHNWPFFLSFNAGRGLATTLGIVMFLFPPSIIILLVCITLAIVAKGTPLPTVIAMIAIPITSGIMGEPLAQTIGFTVLLFIMLFRRLTAPKTPLSDTVGIGERLLYRLLFDRDIRDRKKWMDQKPAAAAAKEGKA